MGARLHLPGQPLGTAIRARWPHPELFLEYPRGLGMDLARFDHPILLPKSRAFADCRVTLSIRTAIADLGLARVDLVHAGTDTYPLAERVRALAVRDLFRALPRRGRAQEPGS